MDQSSADLYVAENLLIARDPKGLALAISFLEGVTEGNRQAYYKSRLIALILWSRLDFTPFVERLCALFLRDFADTKDHGGYWFPWSRQIVNQIANPEIRSKIVERRNDPDPHIKRRAWLTFTYLDYSPVQEARACLVRLRRVKDEGEFQRNPTYAMVYERFVELLRNKIAWEENYQHQKDEFVTRRNQGEEFSESEWAEWRKGFDAILDLYRSSPIWDSINRTGEKKIKSHDSVAIETGLLYLEVDPYWRDSGYTKEWILDQLKYLDLTPYVSRLQSIMLHIVDTHYCREFRHYCRVAPRIDSQEFRDALRGRLNNPDPNVGQRAQWLLDFLVRYSKLGRIAT